MATTRIVHAVVGDFRRRESVGGAVARLTGAGFGPERVAIVAGDPELAREVGGRSHAALGFIGGALAGLGYTILVLAMGGSQMTVNPVGFAIGALGVVGGLAFIGLVFGRSIVTRGPDAEVFAQDVARGDALVTVECDHESCARARDVLISSGAEDVREESSPGPT